MVVANESEQKTQPEEAASAAESSEKEDKQGAEANRKTAVKEKTADAQPAASATELLQRGLDAQNSGRYQEALSEFQKALQKDPANVSIHYLIGSAHHRLGQLEQALASYRQCTSGAYASVAAEHVKTLEKKLSKPKY